MSIAVLIPDVSPPADWTQAALRRIQSAKSTGRPEAEGCWPMLGSTSVPAESFTLLSYSGGLDWLCQFETIKDLVVLKTAMDALRRNNVKVIGSGEQVIMFAHGYGCDQNMWRQVVPSFSDKYTTILFDYVGSGSSEASAFDQTRYSTLRGYAWDVLEILAALKLDRRIHFVGHSVSSMIGALASIEEPGRFNTLTMIGPSPHYINEDDYFGGFERSDIDSLLDSLESNHVAWSAAMAPVIMDNSERPELAQELEASFCRMDPFLAQHFARVTFLSDNRSDLPLVDTRTLILQCQTDAIASVRVGQYVHKSLKNSELVIMDAKGHCPHMSEPTAVVREIRKFLQ